MIHIFCGCLAVIVGFNCKLTYNLQMEHYDEIIYLQKFIPKGTEVKASWDPKADVNKFITKGKCIGRIFFQGTGTVCEIKSTISGRIAWRLSESVILEENVEYGKFEVLKVISCKHELVFEGVCTNCNESGIKAHTRKIFDQISSISASDDLVEEKLNEMLKGGKYILILDLDNTIIHARDAPADYNLFEHFPNETPSEYFETCMSVVNKTKYIVRKRPLLDQFLE